MEMLQKLSVHADMILMDENPFATTAAPIIELINQALNPLLLLVVALGALYCILLGAKLAKAEEPQDREKAKMALKNAVLGFVLIFVLLVALKVGTPAFNSWYSSQASNASTISITQ